MAGMQCPKCREKTFFNTPTGAKCSKCGYTMKTMSNPETGTGGKGKKCSNCREYKVFDNKCRGCGATYK